jgi:hypothetical protein
MFGAGTNIYPGLALFRLGQEFPIEFSGEINLSVVGQSLHRLTLKTTFYLKQSTGKYYYPWDGAPLANIQLPHLFFVCWAPQLLVLSLRPALSIAGGG